MIVSDAGNRSYQLHKCEAGLEHKDWHFGSCAQWLIYVKYTSEDVKIKYTYVYN